MIALNLHLRHYAMASREGAVLLVRCLLDAGARTDATVLKTEDFG